MVLGRFLSADIFRVNSSASLPRSPRGSARTARTPRESAERSPDVRQSPPENVFGRSSPDPCGLRANPHGFERIAVVVIQSIGIVCNMFHCI